MLFSHLNSLTFAQGHFIKNYNVVGAENKREVLRKTIAAMIARFSSFDLEAENDKSQKRFLSGLKNFGLAYDGRIPELVDELQVIADEWHKPTVLEKGIEFAKSFRDTIIEAAVDKALDASAGHG